MLLPKKKIKKPSSARLDGIVNKLTSAARLREEKGDGTPVKKMPIQSMMKRKKKCGQCDNCKRANCGSCSSCQDMPRFGGPGKMKQACKLRKCLASVSTVSNTSFASVSAVGQSSSSLLDVTWIPSHPILNILDRARLARRPYLSTPLFPAILPLPAHPHPPS